MVSFVKWQMTIIEEWIYTTSTRRRVETGHLVAKAGIVRMLHDGHELNDIVAQICDSRKYILCELFIGGHLGLGRTNSN
jgi:hypothetical protein